MKTTLNSNVNPQQQQQQQANVPAVPAQKPPILKPKPKSTNIYATPHSNNNSLSAHNRSTEPLLNSTTAANVAAAILSSFNTSPSTSITDVSSNNCTPQHNLNGIDEAGSLPLSCNIVKHTTFGNGAITTKVTTTTTTTANTPLANASLGAGGYYESVNLLNGTMGRGHKNGMNAVSIDEEIMAVKSNNNNNNNNSSFMSRTLERRHVKNSEC